MFADLDEIDWHQLEHAFGAADDFPGWLRSLASQEDEGAALIHRTTFLIPARLELSSTPTIVYVSQDFHKHPYSLNPNPIVDIRSLVCYMWANF